MKKLYIVGGDGFARELYLHVTSHSRHEIDFVFGGFLGHAGYGNSKNYKGLCDYYLGDVSDFDFNEDCEFVIGAGFPSIRRVIYQDLKELGCSLINFISERSNLADSVSMGEANVILSSDFTCDVTIGTGNVFNVDVSIGHDCTVGDFNFFAPRSLMLGQVSVGDDNSIGTSSVIMAKSKIGSRNKLSPLSVVYKGCSDESVYHGNPALKI